MNRALWVSSLAALVLAGCAGDRTSGTIHQKANLPSSQPIAVLWYTGLFADPHIHNTMVKDGTYEKYYETCTNAWIERTFRANGYTVSARRIQPGERPDLFAGARYTMAIMNKQATITRLRPGAMGAREGFGAVILEMEVDLRDLYTRKSLWTGREVFNTDARRNAAPVLRIVRGLAADGYLDRGPEQVVDYAGRPKLAEDEPACLG